MVQIAGKYEKTGSVGAAEYLRSRGIPEEVIKVEENNKSLEIKANGDNIDIIDGQLKHHVELGKVTETKMPGGQAIKLKGSLNGNTLKIETIEGDGKVSLAEFVFSDNGLEITMTSPSGVQGKRTYKRL